MPTKELEQADFEAPPSWRQYYELTKPGVVKLLVFTAVAGMLLATPGMVPLNILLFGTVGIALASASAAAINHVLDRGIDAEMARTQGRPLPMGRMGARAAMTFAIVLGVVAMVVLWLLVNPLTAVLTFVSLIGYAIVYTLYLKRATSQNIVIGGAAGAAPPLLGWVAVNNEVGAGALLLFLIVFLWTPPHFWALAIARKDEYAKVGIPMLPVTHGVELTRRFILYYTILLVLISVMPFFIGMSGVFYLFGAITLGGGFLYYALALRFTRRDDLPMKTFAYSISYLMALFAFLMVDHYLPAVA
jgi:protoheme IX farnesyltransferase